MRKIIERIILILNITAALFLLLSYLAPLIDPSKFFFPALLGLIYPYLLVTNVAFAIYWLIRLKKEVLISLLVILLGWNHLNNLLPLNLSRKDVPDHIPSSQFLRVLSYNVRGFDIYHWIQDPDIKREMFGLIEQQEPDIVCFQEYFTTIYRGRKHSDIAGHLDYLPHNEVYYATDPAKKTGFGIATFSRYPIIRRSRIPFNTTGNAAMYTDILFRSDTIRVFNVHLQSIRFRDEDYAFMDTLKFKYSNEHMREIKNIGSQLKTAFSVRAGQADMISSYIEDSPHPVIVMGDFNDTPRSYAYRKIKKGMKDAFSKAGRGFGNTYSGNLPSVRIDYILYSDPLIPYQFERIKREFSDHYPITVRLQFPEPAD